MEKKVKLKKLPNCKEHSKWNLPYRMLKLKTNTSNEWKILVIILTWYRHFFMHKMCTTPMEKMYFIYTPVLYLLSSSGAALCFALVLFVTLLCLSRMINEIGASVNYCHLDLYTLN